ncbi:MAG: hypothetical protein QW778_05410 [Candidatus Micrarchaeaceae archaeon]
MAPVIIIMLMSPIPIFCLTTDYAQNQYNVKAQISGSLPIYMSPLDENIFGLIHSNIPNVILTNSFTAPNVTVMLLGYNYLTETSSTGLLNMFSTKIHDGYGFSVIIYESYNQRHKFFDAWFKALQLNKLRMPVVFAYTFNENKSNLQLDPFIYSAPAVAISFAPFGMYVIPNGTNIYRGIISAVNKFSNEATVNGGLISDYINQKQSPISPMVINENTFTNYLGYLGWYSNNAYSYVWPFGPTVKAATQGAAVDYYEAQTTNAKGTWYFFLAYTRNTVYMYSYSRYSFTLNNMESITNWNTSKFPGQVLYDWGPINSGSTSDVSFTLSVGIGIEGISVSVSVSYSEPNGIPITWQDKTNPSSGYVNTAEQLGSIADPAKDYVTYEVSPSSIGLLDPTKSGGYPPLLGTQIFEVNGGNINAFISGWSSQISWNFALWPSSVNLNGGPWNSS